MLCVILECLNYSIHILGQMFIIGNYEDILILWFNKYRQNRSIEAVTWIVQGMTYIISVSQHGFCCFLTTCYYQTVALAALLHYSSSKGALLLSNEQISTTKCNQLPSTDWLLAHKAKY